MPRDPADDKKRRMEVSRADYMKMRSRIEQTQLLFPRQIIVIDPIDEVCDAEKCPAWQGKSSF
jgi:hypothetical protein